jgi:hypothetical protein
VTIDERNANFTIVVAGGKGWIKGGAEASELAKNQVVPMTHGLAGLRVAESPNLLLLKGWKLAPLGELKVDGKPAVGIKASRKGLPDIDLFFDAKTHLPVKVEMRLKEPTEEATYVGTFSDYRAFAGRKCFTRMIVTRNGERVLEMDRSEIQPREKVDDATFSKP